MRKTKLQAIKEVLDKKSPLAHLFSEGMEVQVLVRQDEGIPIVGSFKGISYKAFGSEPYEDKRRITDEAGIEKDEIFTNYRKQWKSFRIPRNANKEPTYPIESPMTFDTERISGIGMSGWNWIEQVSKYVVFDLDSLVGHSDKNPNTLTDAQLDEVRNMVSDLDWVTVMRSTSGTGWHFYVFVDDIPCANHNDHASLAKGVLDKMSLECNGYDFQAKIDVCGFIFWVYHDKMFLEDGTLNPLAFEILQKGRTLSESELPSNWRDNTKVVTGEIKRLTPFPVLGHRPDLDALFDELVGKSKKIPLDDDHNVLIEYLKTRTDTQWHWSGDSHMLVTHTAVLKDAHTALDMKGTFETTSNGSNLTEQNCFCYPLDHGAWSVLRYGKGVMEDDSWIHEEGKYTRCFLNKASDYYQICKFYGGIEDVETKTFFFQSSDILEKLLKALDSKIKIPEIFLSRTFNLNVSKKDSNVAIHIEHDRDDPTWVDGWLKKDRPKRWYRATDIQVLPVPVLRHTQFDDIFRHVTLSGEAVGWRFRNANDDWVWETLQDVRNVAKARFPAISDGELTRLIGNSTDNAWVNVNHPFQGEYVGDRQWNYGASQLSVKPTKKPITEYSTPTWDKILNRLGESLDEPISQMKVLADAGIHNGGDYLKCWIASMLQSPFKKTPYLFFYGLQDSGKSLFHEAVSMLFTTGAVSGKEALSSSGGFNGELQSAIFVYVEEKDLSKDTEAYTRLKDYVTGLTMSLNSKYATPRMVQNSTHWCQFGNNHMYVPLEDGDTRVVVLQVKPLTEDEKLGKIELMEELKDEMAEFLGLVMQLELPKLKDRLTLPVIDTKQKRAIAYSRKNELQTFLEEKTVPIKGEVMALNKFFERFQNWLEESDRSKWSNQRVSKELPTNFPRGRVGGGEGTCFIGNISWFDDVSEKSPKLELSVNSKGVLTND